MNNYRALSKIIILVVSPAILLLFFNSSWNTHKHILANGQIIEHAHPFKAKNSSTPYQNHQHTSYEQFFISFANKQFSTVLFSAVLITIFFKLLKTEYIKPNLLTVVNNYAENYSGRAPPFFFES